MATMTVRTCAAMAAGPSGMAAGGGKTSGSRRSCGVVPPLAPTPLRRDAGGVQTWSRLASSGPAVLRTGGMTVAVRSMGGRGGGRGGRGGGRPPMRVDKGPPRNESIRGGPFRVLGEDKEPLGTMERDEALSLAMEQGLDLVLIVPDADPPVCRIMNYSKVTYERTKRQKEQKKKQKVQKVKELKMRYNIAESDFLVRAKAASRFLKGGDKVKFSMFFRGREMEFRAEGTKVLQKMAASLDELATIDGSINGPGRTLFMTVVPKKGITVKAAGDTGGGKRKKAPKSADGASAEEEDEEDGDDDELDDDDLDALNAGFDDDDDEDDDEGGD